MHRNPTHRSRRSGPHILEVDSVMGDGGGSSGGGGKREMVDA